MGDGKSRRSGSVGALFLALVFLALGGCSPSDPAIATAAGQVVTLLPEAPASVPAVPVGKKPNIVFILMDDASMNLMKYMPQAQRLQDDGTSFSNYYVTNSLCCPSRASIFTGRYPHNTGVFTNNKPSGGYFFFHGHNEEEDTFATDLQAAGYRTAMMGKYLNEYRQGTKSQPGPIPSGWSEWVVGGKQAYAGFNYRLNENGKVRRYGSDPEDYLTDVLAERGSEFIGRAVALKEPFMLELATIAPHAPYTPAPRHRKAFPGLKAPRTPAYDEAVTNAPAWLARKAPLPPKIIKRLDAVFRKRVQSVQAVDDMIARVKDELVAQGVADNTYLVLSSDNGFHLGEHRLRAGKRTAFDTDIQAPLVVVGPGVPAGRTVDDLAANIDLRPTFAALAGAAAQPAVDGRDLSPLMHGQPADQARDVVLIEYRGDEVDPSDPDRQPVASGHPPTYRALRGLTWLYVEYGTGEREYYDIAVDPDQLNNVISAQSADRLAQLHATVVAVERCAGVTSCVAAQQM